MHKPRFIYIMRRFTILTAILIAFITELYGQTSTVNSTPSVQWDQVAVSARDAGTVVVVSARIVIPQGTLFDAPVFPQLEAIDTGLILGSGSPQRVTLPTTAGEYTSDLLTWTFMPGSKWESVTSPTMYCTMFYTPVSGTAGTKVSLGRIEVLRSGVTGIDDVRADQLDHFTRVYTIKGVCVAEGSDIDLSTLNHGIYIICRDGKIFKTVL